MAGARWLVAVPVFNEQRYVRRVLAETRVHAPELLVVDDGSTDGTPELLAAEPDLHVVRHDVNRGYGASLSSAFAFAAERGFDWLITMDCDEQHEPQTIPRFRAAARRRQVDVISGSRYLRRFRGDGSAPSDRRQINARITRMLNERLGLGITDAFCGFKAYRVEALKQLSITEPGYAVPLQFWVQAAARGLRIVELPVRLIYPDPSRQFGGELNDPVTRYQHYRDVFEAEMMASGLGAAEPRRRPVRAAS